MSNPSLKLRRTGRTTRMLEHAKKLAGEGRAVYVIADNIEDARRLEMECGQPNLGIKFETARTLGNFDWENMRLLRSHKNCVVLVDHHAIEDRFHHLLDMLHAYDSNPGMSAEEALKLTKEQHQREMMNMQDCIERQAREKTALREVLTALRTSIGARRMANRPTSLVRNSNVGVSRSTSASPVA